LSAGPLVRDFPAFFPFVGFGRLDVFPCFTGFGVLFFADLLVLERNFCPEGAGIIRCRESPA
jgi:hypothetical protein